MRGISEFNVGFNVPNLSVSKWTIYELDVSEEIPYYRVQRKYLFSQEKVLKWLETRRNMGYSDKMTTEQVEAIEISGYLPRKPFGYN